MNNLKHFYNRMILSERVFGMNSDSREKINKVRTSGERIWTIKLTKWQCGTITSQRISLGLSKKEDVYKN